MTKGRIADVELRRPDLRAPFPRHFRTRLRNQRIESLTRRGKYLFATLSSTDTLIMHLGMSGSFRIEPARGAGRTGSKVEAIEVDRHDHVVFYMSSGARIAFNDPRRFGVMHLLTTMELARHPVLSRLGPEPLSAGFDADVLARAARGKHTTLKAALLDQRVIAGLGNIYASEALHLAGLSPMRRFSTIATSSGTPRDSAHELADAIKQVLAGAVERSMSTRPYRSSRFRVYDREGQPCLRRGCSGTIRRRTQNGRSTFYCPVCQR
jgi:formamidopyrimidine-DNA glycosylase